MMREENTRDKFEKEGGSVEIEENGMASHMRSTGASLMQATSSTFFKMQSTTRVPSLLFQN